MRGRAQTPSRPTCRISTSPASSPTSAPPFKTSSIYRHPRSHNQHQRPFPCHHRRYHRPDSHQSLTTRPPPPPPPPPPRRPPHHPGPPSATPPAAAWPGARPPPPCL